jgi:hypothetical protein
MAAFGWYFYMYLVYAPNNTLGINWSLTHSSACLKILRGLPSWEILLELSNLAQAMLPAELSVGSTEGRSYTLTHDASVNVRSAISTLTVNLLG